MKIKESLKKVGAVAGSALMVGMTMGAAQTLGDFPQPFVNDDGEVASQIVVGSGGQQADVVGAINVAASLGNAAVATEQRTEAVSAGTGSFGWTASAGGQTLDTVNDQLFFNDNLDSVRSTLTGQHLDSLAETTFEDSAGTTTDIETFLYPDNQQVQFGQPQDRNNEDPVLYVSNPANPSTTDYLFRLQANFEDTISFNSSDVEDEEITLFGNTYTVSTNTDPNELKLYGSQVTEDLNTGESTTVTVEGTELTIEAVSASSSTTGAFRVNGELYERDEEGTVTVNSRTVRLDEVIQTNSNNNDGVLQFAIGSQEYTFQDGSKIEDDDGDTIDGTHVVFSGSDNEGDGLVDDLDSIDLYIGSHDDDMEYVTPAENDGMYSHPQFEDFVFHLGGLNPDTGEGAGDNVDSVELSTSGEDTVTVDFTSDAGDEASVDFVHNASGALNLADNDGDTIHVVENATVMENEYFVSDAGDFDHLWEVTSIDLDNSSDEATVSLQDVVSGSQVEIDLDQSGSGAAPYNGSEVIDGQTYYFHVPDTAASSNVSATWGTNAGINDQGDRTTVYSPVDAASGQALAFTNTTTLPAFTSSAVTTTDFNSSFVSQAIQVDTTAAGTNKTYVMGPDGANISELTVLGDDDGTGSSYSLNVGGSQGEVGIYGVNSTGDVTINLSDTASPTGGANVSAIAINASFGSGIFSVSTDSTGNWQIDKPSDITVQNVTATSSQTLELPSTESTDAKTTTVDLEQNYSSTTSGGAGGENVVSNNPVTVGQQQYIFTDIESSQSSADGTIDINLYDGTSTVTDPSLLLVEPEDDNDEEHAYTVTPAYSGGDSEVRVRQIDSYTGSTRTTTSLESDSDVTVGYDFWGTYTSEDSDGQGSVTFHVPNGQATVGAAFTPVGGSLTAGGGGGSGTFTYTAISGYPSLPDMARLDSESGTTVRQNNHLILVGGPAVNTLVADLAEDNDSVWSQQDWLDQSSAGNARLNYVADAFASGQDALIVAGYSASDTQGASRYIANYQENQAALQGQTTVSLTSDDYPG